MDLISGLQIGKRIWENDAFRIYDKTAQNMSQCSELFNPNLIEQLSPNIFVIDVAIPFYEILA